jgi:hypothetical protein
MARRFSCGLRCCRVHHAYTLDPDVLTGLVAQPSALGEPVHVLAADPRSQRRTVETGRCSSAAIVRHGTDDFGRVAQPRQTAGG